MLLRRLLAGGCGGVEDRLQSPEIAMSHDAIESLLCSEEGRSHPAQHHFAVLPVGNASSLDTDTGVRAFDDVGGGQATMQCRGMSSRLMVKHSSNPSIRLDAAEG